jgi:hypothetical protein
MTFVLRMALVRNLAEGYTVGRDYIAEDRGGRTTIECISKMPASDAGVLVTFLAARPLDLEEGFILQGDGNPPPRPDDEAAKLLTFVMSRK